MDLPLHKFLQADGERRVKVVAKDDPDGMRSISLVKVQERAGDFSLLEVTIKTGRTHQIRVHLAASGHPIAGDDKYGDFELNKALAKQGLKRMFLHAASIAFGIRNVADRRAGLAELARVVREGGWVVVLEFSMPRGRLVGPLYRWYFTRCLPLVGGFVSGDREAYRYLPDTVLAWPSPDALRAEMEALGLVECGYRLLSGGVACLSWGRVAAGPARALAEPR